MAGKRMFRLMITVLVAGLIAGGSIGAFAQSPGTVVTAEITGSDPAGGATDFPVDGTVKVFFNEHVEITNYNPEVPRDVLEYTVYIERDGKRYREVPFSLEWGFSDAKNGNAYPAIVGPEKGSSFKWNTTYVIYFSRGTIVPASEYSVGTGITRYYNLSNPEPYYIRFTTKPGLVPAETAPAAGSVAVSPNASIGIRFDRSIVPGDTYGSITLKAAAFGEDVPANVSISGDRLTITPAESLKKGTKYRVLVPESAVKTSDGQISLPWPVDYTFTTEEPAATLTPTPAPKSGTEAAFLIALAALVLGVAAQGRKR